MLKRTAIYEEHVRLGGRLIDFGGWELPVQYSGVMDEHQACREAAGLFDVSHMGEVHIAGGDALPFLNLLVTNDVSKIAIGQAQYTAMCNDEGGIIDDLVIYRRDEDTFLVVVNASNTAKDVAWIKKVAERYLKNKPNADFEFANESAEYSQIALQGRKAQEILQKLTTTPLASIKTYHFAEGDICGDIPAILARTGYTGEDGFEIYVPWSDGPTVWRALLEKGAPLGLKPCGLGARDTLRLEVKYPLYGNELSETTNPLEAGLGWVTKLDKKDFIGKAAILAARAAGIQRQLVGIQVLDRGIPRQGYKLFNSDGSREIGVLTSGTQSPSTRLPIGIGYVTKDLATIGARITVEIRGQKLAAEIVPTPFYKRPY